MSPRQPRLVPDQLSLEQRALYDEITGGPRRGGAFDLVDDNGALVGPFGGFLLSPAVGQALQGVGAAVRYRSRLPDRLRELAILAVAQHHASAFERHAHEAVGRAAGLSEQVLSALAAGTDPALEDPAEIAGLRFTRALLRGDVTDEEWSDIVPVLTLPLAYDLIVLVGYYSTLALQMRVLRVDQV